MGNIFVVAACTAGKGRQGRWVKYSWSDLQPRIFGPTKITRYTVYTAHAWNQPTHEYNHAHTHV